MLLIALWPEDPQQFVSSVESVGLGYGEIGEES
jgi:hypothetical protein